MLHHAIVSPTIYRLTLIVRCGSGEWRPRSDEQNCMHRLISDNSQCHLTRTQYAFHV